MNDDEKKAEQNKARAQVDALVETDREDIAALGRALKTDAVVELSREGLLEGLLQEFVTALQLAGSIASHYLRHYSTQHEPGPSEMLAMMALMEQGESLKAVSVLTARWNALHPDQKPVGVGELMAKLDAATREGSN